MSSSIVSVKPQVSLLFILTKSKIQRLNLVHSLVGGVN